MSWTAILPLKQGNDRKTRLAPLLSPMGRLAFADHMAAHVLACLRATLTIDRVIILSPHAIPDAEWRRDRGRGLNEELNALRSDMRHAALLVIHGDLPLLSPQDIEALLVAATGGIAIAPDRHGTGTNALAMDTAEPFAFAFGPMSFARHRSAAGDEARIVKRPGLALDVDTPEDLDAARAAGFSLPCLG